MQLFARRSEVESVLGQRPFVALPTEERERLTGSVELLADASDGTIPVGIVAIAHRNYQWIELAPHHLYVRSRSSPPTIPGFLDDALANTAHHTLAAAGVRERYELRLAGVLIGDELSLLYVASLLEHTTLRCFGPGELSERDLDATSRMLIQYLDAF